MRSAWLPLIGAGLACAAAIVTLASMAHKAHTARPPGRGTVFDWAGFVLSVAALVTILASAL